MTWRYLAQNLVTGEFLHTNLPLTDVSIEDELSGPGGITGTVAPELLSLLDDTGDAILKEWSTAIYAETGGEIRGAGILVRSSEDDDRQAWTLECPGWSTYPVGNTYEGKWTVWEPDAFAVVRHLWNHLQSFEGGDIGMVVSSANAGVTVGDVKPPDRPKNAAQALKVPTKGNKPVRAAGESEIDYLARLDAWEVDYADRRAVYEAAREAAKEKEDRTRAAQSEWDSLYRGRKPYQLAYWEATDCGDEINRLASEATFEYRERHEWNADKTDVLHHLDLARPTLGRRRDDLRFAVGENVAVLPQPERDGDRYANTVRGLGKGEGQKMMTSTVSRPDGRLRRAAALPLKDVGNKQRLRTLTEAELLSRIALTDLERVVVWDHPNAPLGSWSVGDEILVLANRSGMIREDVWVRVTRTTFQPDRDDRIVLDVVPSERIL